jgi:hypothetical protein
MYVKLMKFRQNKYLTAEPLVPDPSAFDIETAIEISKDINHEVLTDFQQTCSSRK